MFHTKNVLYSEVLNKELYLLPILIKKEKFFVYNKKFFYENWPKLTSDNLIEFIIPLENIEVIQNINKNKNNLLNLDLRNLFLEYTNKKFSDYFN